MFMLLGGNDKKAKTEKKPVQDQAQTGQSSMTYKAKELFGSGRFPVVTTQGIEGRPIAKVLGLVCCRGFDSDDAFFGMATMALNKGAQGIVGYSENVAFHPDGSKYFSCFGTAVIFERNAWEFSPFDGVGQENLNILPNVFQENRGVSQYQSHQAQPSAQADKASISSAARQAATPVAQATQPLQTGTPLASPASAQASGQAAARMANTAGGQAYTTAKPTQSSIQKGLAGLGITDDDEDSALTEENDPVFQRLMAQRRQSQMSAAFS